MPYTALPIDFCVGFLDIIIVLSVKAGGTCAAWSSLVWGL